MIVVDSIVVVLAIVNIVFIAINVESEGLKALLITGIISLLVVYFFVVVLQKTKHPQQVGGQLKTVQQKPLASIMLIGDEGQMIKEWDLMNQVTMLIGRSTKKQAVDIDLTNCTYASLVEPEHATLNFAAEKWYIEDLYSKNGVSIQKAGDAKKYKLSQDRPCQIGKGDTIYIAKTKLLVK